MKEVNKEQIEQAVRQILEAIGEDPPGRAFRYAETRGENVRGSILGIK